MWGNLKCGSIIQFRAMLVYTQCRKRWQHGRVLQVAGFGGKLYDGSTKTKQMYDGQGVYVGAARIGEYIDRGDRFYIGGGRMNHIEVFDS